MKTTFSIRLIASDHLFYDGPCTGVIIPALDGQREVLAHHESVIMAIDCGELKIKMPDGTWQIAIVGSGFARVSHGRVYVLVDTAERPEEIDVKRREIKRLNPETTIEVLIPDFQGRKELVSQVIEAQPEIISHNMETVKRITPLVRSAARYETSLEVIRQIADSGITAKSGIMVGLGETPEEVEELMDDLRRAGCQILTIGQYLQPSHKHYPVAEYVTPAQFASYKETGLAKGFDQVESAPLVRSSYHAEKQVQFYKKETK